MPTYITGTSVTVTVRASKTGFTSPADIERSLTIDLSAPTAPGYTTPAALTVGTAITALNPSGGSGIDSYRATGLPPGLSIHSGTGLISGTPTTANADTASVTVTVSDEAGNTAATTLTFPAVAKGDQTLSGFEYSPASVTFGVTAPTLTAPTGAVTTVGYTATPARVCTVNATSGALTLAGVGSCVITATAASNSNYNEATAMVTVTVQPAITMTVPGAPQQLATQGSNDKVVLSWVAPAETGSSALRGYTLYRGDGGACDNLSPLALEVTAQSASAEDESVSPGVTYCFRLTASNDAGEGAWSVETIVTAVTVGAPKELTVTKSSPDSISLEWRAPATDDGGGPLDGYNVYRCTEKDCVLGEDSWLAWVTDATTYVDNGSGEQALAVDKAYRYAVAASRAGGVSALSNQVLFTIFTSNNPPIANAGPDQTVKAGSQVRLNGSLSEDPDNKPNQLGYSWKQVQGQPVTMNGTTSATPGFVAPSGLEQDEQLEFTLTVTDGILTAEDSVVVTVLADHADKRQKMLELGMAAFGRTVAAEGVDVFSGRFAALESPERNRVKLGGRQLDLAASSSLAGAFTQVVEWLGLPAPVVNSDATADAIAGNAGVEAGGTADNHSASTSWRGPNSDWNGGSPTDSVGQSGGLDSQTISLQELLSDSAFQMALDEQDDTGLSDWTLWGRGSVNRFKGRHENGHDMDGDVFSGYLGLDFRWDRNALLGIAVSHSQGEMDYQSALTGEGKLETTLTSIYYYLHYTPRAGINLWGTVGYGWGDAELTDKEVKDVKTDLTMWLLALGARNELSMPGNIDVAIKTDAFATWLDTDEKGTLLPEAQADSSRLRLILEGSTDWALTGDSRLTPSLELGARWDGGDAETGLGMELGGGLSYTNTRLGLEIDARGRYLLMHEDSGYEEWGASVMARTSSDPDGEGLSLSFAPTWGRAASGIDRLWGGGQARHPGGLRTVNPRSSSWIPQRVELKLGYGSDTILGLLAPFGELSMVVADVQRLRLGTRLTTRNGWIWHLLGERLSGQSNEADYLIGLFASYRFGSRCEQCF